MNLQENIRRILREEVTEDKNLYGEKLKPCSTKPMTGYYRDGYCRTGDDDTGSHTVCARVTEEFLEFTNSKGNNLDMLEPGDKWCLCAKRWEEANKEGVAPKMIKSSTNIKTLDIIDSDEQELDEYSRTLKNARRQGVGLRFSKSAVKANPQRFRKYTRYTMNESENKKSGLLRVIEEDGLFQVMQDTGLTLPQIYTKTGELPREVFERYIKDFIKHNGFEQTNDVVLLPSVIGLHTNVYIKFFYLEKDKVTLEINEYDRYGEQDSGSIESIINLSDEELFTIVDQMTTQK
jgi:uncharacterized protein (DUF2237 family)